jgi:hypothetical protein
MSRHVWEVSMKRSLVSALALLVGAACSQSTPPSATTLTAPSPVSAALTVPKNYRAHLSGSEVVPPLPVTTHAEGEAILQLSPDGLELSFRAIASNITNVTGVHIHLGALGLRGPLVVFLLGPSPAGGGRIDGVLGTGAIKAANLIGPLAGHPLSELMAEIAAGNAYVDVPTSDGVFPPNTGLGDFMGGEIRGQLR